MELGSRWGPGVDLERRVGLFFKKSIHKMSYSFIETHFSDWKNTDLDENTNNNVDRLLVAMEILTQIGQLFADTCQAWSRISSAVFNCDKQVNIIIHNNNNNNNNNKIIKSVINN